MMLKMQLWSQEYIKFYNIFRSYNTFRTVIIFHSIYYLLCFFLSNKCRLGEQMFTKHKKNLNHKLLNGVDKKINCMRQDPLSKTSRVTRMLLDLWIGNETLCKLRCFGNARWVCRLSEALIESRQFIGWWCGCRHRHSYVASLYWRMRHLVPLFREQGLCE